MSINILLVGWGFSLWHLRYLLNFPGLYGFQRYSRNFIWTALFQGSSRVPRVNEIVNILFDVVLKVLKCRLEAVPYIFIILSLTRIFPMYIIHYLNIVFLVQRWRISAHVVVSRQLRRFMIKLPSLFLEFGNGIFWAYRTVECLKIFRLLIKSYHGSLFYIWL